MPSRSKKHSLVYVDTNSSDHYRVVTVSWPGFRGYTIMKLRADGTYEAADAATPFWESKEQCEKMLTYLGIARKYERRGIE